MRAMFVLSEQQSNVADKQNAEDFHYQGGHIKLQGVSFKYPTFQGNAKGGDKEKGDRWILKNLDLEIAPGQTAAVL